MRRSAACAAAAFLAAAPGTVHSAATMGGDAVEAPAGVVLFVMDDASAPHSGTYGDPAVRTPRLDRLARQGLTFRDAFAVAPACTPSRASLLTGRLPHRLGPAFNQWSSFPDSVSTVPDLLTAAGWAVGHAGKGWDPGLIPDGALDPAGPEYASLDAFLDSLPPAAPFWFWVGSHEPHRPYRPAGGAVTGLREDDAPRAAFLPDVPEVRADLIDYLARIEAADRELTGVVRTLEEHGRGASTAIFVTSDNGMPFPRAKANVYDAGTRVPLVWTPPATEPFGRGSVSGALVDLTDVAATALAAAGLAGIPGVDGLDLRPLLRGEPPPRDAILLGRERHAPSRAGDLGYPVRALRTTEFLYVRNLRPERWPAGDPRHRGFEKGFGDIDPSPTKTWLVDHREDAAAAGWVRAALERRPAEELYDLAADPDQVVNVAGRAVYAETLERLRRRLDDLLVKTGDPRVAGSAADGADPWDDAPYLGPRMGRRSVE